MLEYVYLRSDLHRGKQKAVVARAAVEGLSNNKNERNRRSERYA